MGRIIIIIFCIQMRFDLNIYAYLNENLCQIVAVNYDCAAFALDPVHFILLIFLAERFERDRERRSLSVSIRLSRWS